MTHLAEEVLRAANALSPEDRSELIDALLATEADQPLSDEWMAEIRRRSAEYDAGLVQGIPWSEVKRQARDRGTARE
jgi:putative addiction module component (TIGR02574 family)